MTMIKNHLAVAPETLENAQQAQQLALRLGLDYLAYSHNEAAKNYDYLLLLTPHYLGLIKTASPQKLIFYIDFLSAKQLFRMKQAGLRKEKLARAIGFKPGDKAILVDATAGLGRDSFMLAALGFEIIMLERSPIVHALLKDALTRGCQDIHLAPIMERMHLYPVDAIAWLQERPQQVDVVYLDPMFPERKKSASVKKEMVILQELLGKDENDKELFQQALACARHRVVVKRPRLAANLANREPSFSLSGKSSRFDVYLTSKPKTD